MLSQGMPVDATGTPAEKAHKQLVHKLWETCKAFLQGRLAPQYRSTPSGKLPPRHIDQGPDGVRRDLEALRVFYRLFDGRVNIPDVFRVGYGLGRKGGVKPVK